MQGVVDSWAEKNMTYDEQEACGRAGNRGGQGTGHRTGMTTRAGPELSARQHQDCANKSQGAVMQRAGCRAQQTKQGAETEWKAAQNN